MEKVLIFLSAHRDVAFATVEGDIFDVSDSIGKEIYETNPVLIRLYHSYSDLVYFRLAISELDYYDLTPTPPILKHYNL